MPQLPEKIDLDPDAMDWENTILIENKLNEIIDYLGELEGGGKDV